MGIRIAGPGDIDAITDVHIRSSKAAYANLPASVVSVSREARRIRWDEAIADPDSRVWVAEKAGTVVGFCHLRLFPRGTPDAGSAEITSLYIDPAHWREGVGRALAVRARHAAADHQCSRIFLKVFADNDRARAAYEAIGFTARPETIIHERTGLPLVTYEIRLVEGAS